MTLKKDLKIFLQTAIFSTALFFIFGNIIFKGLLNYGDWTLVFFPAHIISTLIVMTPLLLAFWYIDKKRRNKLTSVIHRVGLRTTIGALYIATLLWVSIFSDTMQRTKDPFNYYADLKYLGLCTLITILTFAVVDYYSATKIEK